MALFRIKTDIEQKLFILAIIFIPINHFIVEFPIVGGDISKLFALLGICIYMCKICMKKAELDSFERFALFYLAVYFLWQCLCTTIGILEYDYYDIIYPEQMDKLRYLLQNLRQTGMDIDDLTAMKVWLWVRFLKDCLFNTLAMPKKLGSANKLRSRSGNKSGGHQPCVLAISYNSGLMPDRMSAQNLSPRRYPTSKTE